MSNYLDGVLKTISIFLADANFVPIFGVIPFEIGSVKNDAALKKQLKDVGLVGTSITTKFVEWREEFDILFETWVAKSNHNQNKSKEVLSDEHLDEIYELIIEFIEAETKPLRSICVGLSGPSWEYDSEGLVIEGVNDCYLIYFMWSD